MEAGNSDVTLRHFDQRRSSELGQLGPVAPTRSLKTGQKMSRANDAADDKRDNRISQDGIERATRNRRHRAPVLAMMGLTFHDLSGVRYQQDLDTVRLMQDVALYNVEVTGPQHAINAPAEVMFEEREIGNPNYGCQLPPIDFVAFAKACGADGFRCQRPEEVRPAIQAALASPKQALVVAVVDPEEKPARPDELRV
jgi:thiamine pyrophosphate-dependent acetolactate synthase large subunit-like protein